MPRRKKTIEPEILLPEDDQPKRGQQVVEAKHTIEFKAPHIVPVEEPQEEEIDPTDDDIEIEDKPTRKPKDEHKKLRELLAQHNIAPTAQLRLSIERYLHSESSEGGTWSEKEFLTRYICTKEQIVNEDYLDVARKWGAGTYWFTLRMYTPGRSPGSRVVASWEKRLGPAAPAGPIIQNANPADPNSPQVIVQGDGQQTVMPSIKDIMKVQREALKEQLEMAKLMREAYGFAPEQSQQQPRTEEEVLAGAILKQPEIIENVVGSVIKRFGGAGGKDDEPWYADVVRDAVKSGQLVQVVQVAIDRIFNGVGNLFPGRQNNGQAEMAQTQFQGDQRDGSQIHNPQAGQEALASNQQSSETGMLSSPQSEVSNQAGAQQPPPEGHAMSTRDVALNEILGFVIEQCANKANVMDAADSIDDYIESDVHPFDQAAISAQLKAFAALPIETVIEYVKQLPNGEQIASLPHAKEWTTELQRLIKEAGQEGEDV